jgi:hypothetical protein
MLKGKAAYFFYFLGKDVVKQQAIDRSLFISAPVQRVFAFLSEPKNHREVCPGLITVSHVDPLPSGGYCYDSVIKFAGYCFDCRSEWKGIVKDQRIVIQYFGEMHIMHEYVFRPMSEGSRINLHIEYEIPAVVLEDVPEAFVLKMNENEAEGILANIKARLE